MSRIPVVGGFFERFLLLTDETDEDYIEHRKYEIIQEQIESITTDLGSIGGISVDRLDEDDLLVLNEEYWTGEKLPRHYDNIVHRTPVVTVDSGVDHTDIEDKDSRSLEEEIEQISEQVAEEVESESPVQGGAADGDGGAVSAATGGD
jgi:Flp pilus assembly CpaF family ATPase